MPSYQSHRLEAVVCHFSGRGGAGASSGVGREMRNRLSTTCCGVRTQGARDEDRGDSRHALLVGLLAFVVSRARTCWLRTGWLDHGNALAIDGCHQDGASGGLRRTLPVKSVEVLRHVGQDLLQAAFGDGRTPVRSAMVWTSRIEERTSARRALRPDGAGFGRKNERARCRVSATIQGKRCRAGQAGNSPCGQARRFQRR